MTTITKYTHACLDINKNGQRLIIDPGSFTELPSELSSVVGVVVTEEHGDHYNLDNIKAILAASPEAIVYSTQNVVDQLAEAGVSAQHCPETATVGTFKLRFFETDHAPVYQVSPCRSTPVLVDDLLYYPSDSYHVIDAPYRILALPTSGPWQKLSESIDFAKQCNFSEVIATHNGLYNETGVAMANDFIKDNIVDDPDHYHDLAPGESMTVTEEA